MTAPWQAMPDFVDGTVVDEGDLDPIVFNLNLVRRAGRILQGKILSTAGVQYATAGGAVELNMPKLQMSNVTIEANRPYWFGINMLCQTTIALDTIWFRIRQNTALTGAELVLGRVTVPVATRDLSFIMILPWKPAVGGVMSFFTSMARGAGSGVESVFGNLQTAVWIEKAGDDGTEWALVP